MPYTVKAFRAFETLEESYETHDQAEARFDKLTGEYDAAYVYNPNGEIVKSYSDTYDNYQPYEPACGYCGSTVLDGYCWRSPDGTHHEDYDF